MSESNINRRVIESKDKQVHRNVNNARGRGATGPQKVQRQKQRQSAKQWRRRQTKQNDEQKGQNGVKKKRGQKTKRNDAKCL